MLTKIQNREKIIEQWMLTIANDGGVRRFDDLHIDKIDLVWKPRQQWIAGGLAAHRFALAVRDRHQLPFTVGLGFSLKSRSRAIGVDFRTPEEFCERLDWSPPSLYLFHRGEEPDKQIGPVEGVVRYLSLSVLGGKEGTRCYYLEYRKQGSDEYRRSVFIEG
jgi:hypothetical protein